MNNKYLRGLTNTPSRLSPIPLSRSPEAIPTATPKTPPKAPSTVLPEATPKATSAQINADPPLSGLAPRNSPEPSSPASVYSIFVVSTVILLLSFLLEWVVVNHAARMGWCLAVTALAAAGRAMTGDEQAWNGCGKGWHEESWGSKAGRKA